ncbi:MULTISPECIES: hypothetical protein [Nostoc]|uniref:hypothetical protein n=1 Tax=Nostoc TaxID=1177 RepID=UPI0018EFC575|nr:MULTISPECIES: hypothetical protein [Nostoc]
MTGINRLRSRVSWKLSCTVLKTSEVGDSLTEFNAKEVKPDVGSAVAEAGASS